jgi:uncharacterized protein DUF3237
MQGYELEHIFSSWATVGKPQLIGPTPEGISAIFPAVQGEVAGPKLRGTVLPGGGDWLTVRRDGVQVIDVRATVKTHDGALVYIAYTGVGDLGENGYERFLRGDLPRTIALRASGRFQAADPRYTWLNRLQCLLVGEADREQSKVSYDVYAVR